jgi:GxxExxY protein
MQCGRNFSEYQASSGSLLKTGLNSTFFEWSDLCSSGGMDTAPRLHQDVTDRIIRVFWDVVNELGTGYLEKIYLRATAIALRQAGFEVIENYKTAVSFRGELIGYYVFDLVVNGCILLELKATGAFERAHAAQAVGYLRSSSLEVALILNFGHNPSVHRVSMTNDRKRLHQFPEKVSTQPDDSCHG